MHCGDRHECDRYQHQAGREPQRFDGWCVTAADLKDLNPAANWSVSRGYSDSTRAAW